MTENELAALGKVPFRTISNESLQSERYTDPAFFEQERAKLWLKTWHIACRLEQIPAVGDYAAYSIMGKSVLIIHTSSGIGAFHNACRHKGVPLMSGHGNCRESGIPCHAHNWKWNMEGENILFFASHIPHRPDANASDLNLLPCRFETWGGYVFVTFDEQAPPLATALGSITEQWDPGYLAGLKVTWWFETELHGNWKSAVEALLDGPGLLPDDRLKRLSETGLIVAETIFQELRHKLASGPPADGIRDTDKQRCALDHNRRFVFPNIFMSALDGGVLCARVRPLKSRTYCAETWYLAPPRNGDICDPVEPQKLDSCMASAFSAGASPALPALCRAVGAVGNFHHLIDAFLAGIPAEKSADDAQLVSMAP